MTSVALPASTRCPAMSVLKELAASFSRPCSASTLGDLQELLGCRILKLHLLSVFGAFWEYFRIATLGAHSYCFSSFAFLFPFFSFVF